MKKLISVLLAVCFIGAMACGLVGCEKSAAPVEDTTVADTVVTEEPTATDTEVESDTGDVDTTETTVDSGAETTAEETNPETDSTEDTTVTE